MSSCILMPNCFLKVMQIERDPMMHIYETLSISFQHFSKLYFLMSALATVLFWLLLRDWGQKSSKVFFVFESSCFKKMQISHAAYRITL